MDTAADTNQELAPHHRRAATAGDDGAGDTSVRPPTRLSRRRPPISRVIAIVAAALAMVVASVGSAQAGEGFIDAEHVETFFYGDFDREVLLFAGGTTVDFCNGQEAAHDARIFARGGSVDVRVDSSDVPIYLYSSPLGAPELIGATCEAMFDADPLTVPLEPFAVGEGRARLRLHISPDGTVEIVNSTVGTATSVDGTVWKVRGWADLQVVDGMPVGSPSEFQGLRIGGPGA